MRIIGCRRRCWTKTSFLGRPGSAHMDSSATNQVGPSASSATAALWVARSPRTAGAASARAERGSGRPSAMWAAAFETEGGMELDHAKRRARKDCSHPRARHARTACTQIVDDAEKARKLAAVRDVAAVLLLFALAWVGSAVAS